MSRLSELMRRIDAAQSAERAGYDRRAIALKAQVEAEGAPAAAEIRPPPVDRAAGERARHQKWRQNLAHQCCSFDGFRLVAKGGPILNDLILSGR